MPAGGLARKENFTIDNAYSSEHDLTAAASTVESDFDVPCFDLLKPSVFVIFGKHRLT